VGIKEVRKYNIRLKVIKIQHFVALGSAITTAFTIISVASELRSELRSIYQRKSIHRAGK
jgi:hypothetical protein